ncbi:MAG: hypothetical protein LBH13_03325 [Cellulomonadaceae bacterium]|nr:hypothetical protein [Cellulomonadaceae bacterium]
MLSTGAILARVDMAWLLPDGTWLFAEIDGAEYHSAPRAVYADRQRQNALMRLGKVMRFTGKDAWNLRIGAAVGRELEGTGWVPGAGKCPEVIRAPD